MATTYLTRTPSIAGNQKTWTLSGWFKFADVANVEIFGLSTASNDASTFSFVRDNTGALRIDLWTAYTLVTNRRLRDPNAWYHIVLRVDTTDSTADDRVRLYINGTQETSFSTRNNPAEDYDFIINSTTAHFLGVRDYSGSKSMYFNGEMAHTHFADGQSYAPTVFGSTDATSGIWVPNSAPSVTYGENGFFLKYASGAFGTDSSGEGNTMTVSGTITPTKDNAMNNFATMNPLDNYWAAATLSNGNNTVVTTTGKYSPNLSTFGMTSGKWYWEVKPTAGGTPDWIIGICSTQTLTATNELGDFVNDWGYYADDGKSRNNNTGTSYGDSYAVDDIIGVALDLTNSKLYFSKNGVWQNSGVPTSGATGTGALSITAVGSTPLGAYFTGVTYWANVGTLNTNFGNGYFGTTVVTSSESDSNSEGSFEYAPPTDYLALCTNNLGSDS